MKMQLAKWTHIIFVMNTSKNKRINQPSIQYITSVGVSLISIRILFHDLLLPSDYAADPFSYLITCDLASCTGHAHFAHRLEMSWSRVVASCRASNSYEQPALVTSLTDSFTRDFE